MFNLHYFKVNFSVNNELIDTYFFDKIEEYIQTQSMDPNNSLDYKIIISGHLSDVIIPLSKENFLTVVYAPIKD